MPTVRFTSQLRRFFPTLETRRVSGSTVAEVLRALDRDHPGLRGYIVDDQGALRKHVNIFIGDTTVVDRRGLTDAVTDGDTVSFFQALSGGASTATSDTNTP